MIDVALVGGGIAGAGAAYFLSLIGAQVVILERESLCGYHTTGRSAAFFAESYGGPVVRPLTQASRYFFDHPPAGFTDTPLLTKRGAIHVFRQDQQDQAKRMLRDLGGLRGARILDRAELKALAPHVTSNAVVGGVYDPGCADIDVAALLQGYLRAARHMGAEIFGNAELLSLGMRGDGGWHLETKAGSFEARYVVNAAGAWADDVARLAGVNVAGLAPMRRTIAVTESAKELSINANWPLVLDIEEDVYFKPEGDGFLISPADETPVPAQDIQAEDYDVAVAVDRFEKLTGMSVEKLVRSWAGLRSFAPDRGPVIGADPSVAGFYWSAGQGGWGIQTSPAWSALLASQLCGALGKSTQSLDELIPGLVDLPSAHYLPDRLHG